jgi:arylsulfatase
MGELFSDAGYATGMFGKWHLGRTEDRIPTAQGFDEWWGISESSDEAGWTAHPMYPDFLPRPKIKQAVKGQPFEEVDDFDLETRRSPTGRSTSSVASTPQVGRSTPTSDSPTCIHR